MQKCSVIEAINAYEAGNWKPMKQHRWLMYLAMAKEQRVNYEYIDSMQQLQENRLISYVKKTLDVLGTYALNPQVRSWIESVLVWSEVAKGGTEYHQCQWEKEGINLYAHNEGSAAIYMKEYGNNGNEIVETLIETHGLLGQYIRGEVPLSHSQRLLSLRDVDYGDMDFESVLLVLNHCIIAGVSQDLWLSVKQDIQKAILDLIEENQGDCTTRERLKQLRRQSALQGEDFEQSFRKVSDEMASVGYCLQSILDDWMTNREIWYFEAALHEFTFEEVIKIILLSQKSPLLHKIKHISFEEVMKDMYYDYQGEKKINLYKKRMIEKYLGEVTYGEIMEGKQGDSTHLSLTVTTHPNIQEIAFIMFDFTKPAINLINFCVEAERAQLGYERAIVLVYDYFGLRKDKYDRFHNEASYLATMNQSIDYKQVILEYIVGETVMDIGPGGGALMDLIEENHPTISVLGVDISMNVIEALNRKKHQENRQWNVRYGDALNLSNDFAKGSIDTIIFCSIIHELYSYIEMDGKVFNRETIRKALVSAYDMLPVGGRIIIRDGIMTEPMDQSRIIEFNTVEGMNFLERYAKDFKGRRIHYEKIGYRKVKMPVNDAMEFLYTYTWGEESYAHEINEQFGYFTPSAYEAFIKESLGDSVQILVSRHYLQEGYTTALEPKIQIYDASERICSLPDSTCLIVIEKMT